MTCIECNEESKYKCPNCLAPYCSVGCYKKHKQKPCSKPPDPPKDQGSQNKTLEYEYPTEDTVPIKKLNLLEKSMELKQCLKNPHVRKMLELLDTSTNPEELISDYMQEPIFTEFVDICLNVVQTKD